MRMVEFHIDGFGRFAGLSHRDIPPGLSIVRGDNEAGKSTLLAFLRSVLFGLPTRLQKEYYPPLQGGRKGGRIVLQDGSRGRIVVERFEGKKAGRFTVTFPDGSQGGEDEFRRHLGAATADLYSNVFAFSLSELQSFESLQTEKVRDAIYSAGTGVGRRSIVEVTEDLRKLAGELFAPQASKPRVNRLLSSLEQIDRQLRQHEQDQGEYEAVYTDLKSCTASIEEIGQRLSRDRRRRERLVLLRQAWDDWVQLCDSRDLLDGLPVIETFPADGVERLDALNLEQRGLADRIAEARAQMESCRQELGQVPEDTAVLDAATAIRRIDRTLKVFEQSCRDCEALGREQALLERQLGDCLRDVGGGWDEARLRAFDLSVPVREEIGAGVRACAGARAAVHDRDLQREQQQKQCDAFADTERQAAGGLEQVPLPCEKIDLAGIRTLQLGRQTWVQARADLPVVAKQCEAHATHLRDTLRAIGLDWDEARLEDFDSSLAVQEQVAAHQRRIDRCRQDSAEAARRVREAREALDHGARDLQCAEDALSDLPAPGVTDEERLAARARSLRTLRRLLAERDAHLTRQRHLEERRQDLQDQLARLETTLGAGTGQVPRLAALLVFAAGVVCFVALGIARDDWLSAALVLAASAMPIVLRSVVGRRRALPPDGVQTLQERASALDREIAAAQTGCAEAVARIDAEAAGAGLDRDCSAADLDRAAEDIERDRKVLQDFLLARGKRDDAAAHLTACRERREQAEAAATNAAAAVAAAQQQWQQWLEQTGLPAGVSPDGVKTILSRIDTAREQLRVVADERGRIAQMNAAIDAYEADVTATASRCAFAEAVPGDCDAAVAFLGQRLEEHEHTVRVREDAARRLDEARAHTAAALQRLQEAEQRCAAAREAEATCLNEWHALAARVGLPPELSPENAPQLLQAIERAREHLDRVEQGRARLQALQEQLQGYCEEVRSVCAATGRPGPAPADVPAAVAALSVALAEAEAARTRARELHARISDHENAIARLQTGIDQRRDTIAELFSAAAVTDEEAFRRNAADYARHGELRDRISTLQTRLRQLVGGGEGLDALEAELGHTSPEGLAHERGEVERSITATEAEQRAAIDRGGQLKTRLEQLETTEDVSELRVQEQACRAELESASEEWAVLKIAEYLVDRAREKYERERRPAVLKAAERYFSSFTAGRYTELRAPAGQSRIVVMTPGGATREIDQLSRGTAEQLYLSLRFGFVQEFVTRSEPLPLVFDDILVNFDPGRARAAAQSILELSRSLQILLFTCHPATVDLVRGIDTGVPVYALEDGSFRPV